MILTTNTRKLKKSPKVLLLSASSRSVVQGYFPMLVPSGLQEIFFFLRENEVDVRMVDCNLYNFEDVSKLHFSEKYDVVGISTSTSHNYLHTMDLVRFLRKNYGDSVTIVVGGTHATALPEDFLLEEEDARPDFVVTGYGEQIMLSIVRGEDVSKYATLNKYILNDQNILTNVPKTRYAFNAAQQEERLEFCSVPCRMLINLSRGCVNRCTYCMMSGCRQPYICRDIDTALEIIESLDDIPKQVEEVFLSDPCFGYNKLWRHEIFKAMKQKPYTRFSIFMMAEAFDEEDYELLSGSNIGVTIGTDSFSPQMLRIMNKTKKPNSYINAAENVLTKCAKNNVRLDCDILMNHPGETPHSQKETTDKARQLNDLLVGDSVSWSFFEYAFFPGTRVFKQRKHYEEKYGARFVFPKWWYQKKNQYDAARACIPSDKFGTNLSEILKQKLNYRTGLKQFTNSNFHLL